jgi:hypothetical protein
MVILLAALLLAAGCGDDDDDFNNLDDTARLMVVQAGFGLPTVEVLVDDEVEKSDLDYLETTGYFKLTAGEHNVKVREGGTQSPFYVDVDITLTQNQTHSLFIADTASDLSTHFTVDNAVLPDTTGQAIVRLVNLALQPEAITIKNSVDSEVVAQFDDIAYGESTDFYAVTAGDWAFEIRDPLTDQVYYTSGNLTLQSGSTYTLLAHGLYRDVGNTSLSLTLIENL